MPPFRIDLHVHGDHDALAKLTRLITKEFHTMSAALDRLTTEVTENTEVINSAVTLIEGLAQQIRDNATDPTKLNKLADDLDAQSNKLAAAVSANTPEPPVVPPIEDATPGAEG